MARSPARGHVLRRAVPLWIPGMPRDAARYVPTRAAAFGPAVHAPVRGHSHDSAGKCAAGAQPGSTCSDGSGGSIAPVSSELNAVQEKLAGAALKRPRRPLQQDALLGRSIQTHRVHRHHLNPWPVQLKSTSEVTMTANQADEPPRWVPWALIIGGICAVVFVFKGFPALKALGVPIDAPGFASELGILVMQLIIGGFLAVIIGMVLALKARPIWMIISGAVLLCAGTGPLLVVGVMAQ